MVLGSEIKKSLFPDSDPVGKIVRLSLFNRFDFRFLVTGVMKPKGGDGDEDFSVYIPVSTMQNRIGFLRNPTGDVNVASAKIYFRRRKCTSYYPICNGCNC